MRRRTVEFLVLAFMSISVAIGSGPVGAAIWQWSTTASTNASADPSINWAENMAPSSVNDSARAMMAAIAAWRNDISAVNATAGTLSAYTLTTSEGVSATPVNGQMVSFLAHLTNGANPTLTVDGGNTYPIYLNNAVAPVGSMIVNTPYRVAFNSILSAWLLEGSYGSPYNVPLGSVIWTTLPTAPNSNFLSANGQCASTTTYNAYWVALGSPAPTGGCGGGLFQLLDLRGRVVAGLDTLPGQVAAGRMTSSSNGCGTAFTTMGAVCANGFEGWILTQTQMPSHYHGAAIFDPTHVHAVGGAGAAPIYGTFCSGCGQGGGGSFGTSQAFSILAAATGVRVNGAGGLDTTSATGGGGQHPSVQPTLGLYPWIRVL